MHFWSQSSFSLTYNVVNTSLKDLHCILPSKGFFWSTGFHTPEIAKLFGDTCSANLHPLCNLPEHTVQWHFSLYLLVCQNGSCLPLIFSLWGRDFSRLLFLCGIRVWYPYCWELFSRCKFNIATSVPAAFTGGEDVKGKWKPYVLDVFGTTCSSLMLSCIEAKAVEGF